MTEQSWHEYLDDSALDENSTDERIVDARAGWVADTLDAAYQSVLGGRRDPDEYERLEIMLLNPSDYDEGEIEAFAAYMSHAS